MDRWIKQNKITCIFLVLLAALVTFYISKQSTTNVSSDTFGLAPQAKCADQAKSFYKQGGYEDSSVVWTNSYINHWNSKLNKCFIQITGLSQTEAGFSYIDVYDAFEGKHYATYMGYYDCAELNADTAKKCQLDSGSIWFDGNDTRNPADYHVGFQGAAVGPGVGDKNTQKQFLDHLQSLMSD